MWPIKIKKKLKEDIIQSLYQYDFYQEELKKYNSNVPENIPLFQYIIDNISIIDRIIEKNLYNYQINRLNKVDKAIIRLATLELLEKKVSYRIIINEAIELTRKFTCLEENKQCKFNNKLLQLIYEDIRDNNYIKKTSF
ncbi:transcription antitermination factor NusB [Candidatus Phytoplasma pini]|uniref:Transcription antitermination factor n=1 Tax=Candidatus Phytoplasma pini TaxID=267362 RepID=A0A559KK29_9MOLU|nr:transcription antitermination factor NusB [Candidatus Phytoplasma pini]TVY12458.1 Transcription antitermination factor [Candidatus Phytoplasma pini]